MRKVCRTCGVEKNLKAFYRHPTYADGHMNDCKLCKRAYQRDMHWAKRDQVLAYKREWSRRPENVAKRKAYAQTEKGRAIHRECCRIYNAFKRAMSGSGGVSA